MNRDALPVLAKGVAHVVLHLRNGGRGGKTGVLASGLIHDGLHRDGNLVLGLGVAELIDGTGGRRDLLHRVGVGLGVIFIGACFSGQVRLVERHGAKGRRDVVELGGIGLPCLWGNRNLGRFGHGGFGCIVTRSLDAELERHIFVFIALRPVRIANRFGHRDLHGRSGKGVGNVDVVPVNRRALSLGPRDETVLVGHRELINRGVQVVAKRSLGLNKRVRTRQQTLERELARRGVGVCPRGIARSRLVALPVDHGPGLVGRTIGVLFLGELPLRTRQRSVFCVVLRHLGPRHRTGDPGVGNGTRGVILERNQQVVVRRIHITLNIVHLLAGIVHGCVVDGVRLLVALRRCHLFDVVGKGRVHIRNFGS